ncbi:DnaJ domain-containing protein [Halomicrobium zhouii]|uniref:DnaJ domain-containing protein n=1 Tax=Halomicrobium zhouii TaxID=767519 RepID=A0A1I6LVV6_9EURY|nr:J domain-containing protein [Halomicrobium zhouii]SFS07402.1 DnaJ domain-containing protein [Halomicrobium zhouii]
MTQTFYDVLGVPPDASTDRIRAAYRERLKESHPDLNDDEDANEATRRIIRARDVLTDESERERYDEVGHEAYVGDDASPVDDEDVSDAATAARRAGWGDGTENESTSSRSATDDHRDRAGRSGADRRRRARDRRRRERAARERVDREADRTGDGSSQNRTTRDTSSQDRATRDATSQATATTDGGSTTADAVSVGGVGEAARSWNGSGGFSVRQRYDTGRRRRMVPTGKSMTLLAVSMVLYPLMLFSALFPPFPLLVNVIVGFCTVFLVGYLQSQPEVGVMVFGSWSLLTPVAFAAVGVPLTGLVGIAALTGTWLPLGLSVATLVLVRP